MLLLKSSFIHRSTPLCRLISSCLPETVEGNYFSLFFFAEILCTSRIFFSPFWLRCAKFFFEGFLFIIFRLLNWRNVRICVILGMQNDRRKYSRKQYFSSRLKKKKFPLWIMDMIEEREKKLLIFSKTFLTSAAAANRNVLHDWITT